MTPKKAFINVVDDYRERWWDFSCAQNMNLVGKLIMVSVIVFLDIMALSILPIIFILELCVKESLKEEEYDE